MPRTRLASAALTGAALLVSASAFALAPAHAAPLDPACASRVVTDRAGILDVAVVEQAALVEVPDADVKVVTFASVPDLDGDGTVTSKEFDAAVGKFRDRCDARRGTSIVLAVSRDDRLSGVYYGAAFDDTLGQGRWKRVNSDMQARFPDDFTGGLTRALARTGRLTSQTVPEDDGAYDDFYEDGFDGGYADEEAREPVDVAWEWVLGVPAGAAALAGGGYGAVRLRRRLKARDALRASAHAQTDEAADTFMQIEPAAELLAARVAAMPAVDDEAVVTLREEAAGLAVRVSDAVATYLGHTARWTDAAIDRADLTEAGEADRSADATDEALDGAMAAVTDLDERLTALEDAFRRIPTVLGDVEAGVREAYAQADGLDRDGYFTKTHRTEAAGITSAVAATREAHDHHLWGAAVDGTAAALARSTALVAVLGGLRARRQKLVDDVAAARARHATLAPELDATDATVDEVAEGYHSECAEGPRTDAGEGRAANGAVPALLDDTDRAVGMDAQRFDDADASLAAALAKLDRADAAVAGVREARRHLLALADQLPGRVRTEQDVVRATSDVLAANPAAVRFVDPAPDLDGHRARAAEAATELDGDRPRLLTLDVEVAALAEDVRADRERVDATVAAYEATVAALAQARAAVRDADAVTSRAHAGNRARGLFGHAARVLAEAEQIVTLASATEGAHEAVRIAQSAEYEARRAIRAHQDEQNRRAAFAAGASRSSSSFGGGHGFSGGGGGGGGGSSSFGGGGGSGGGGGGGSSSW